MDMGQLPPITVYPPGEEPPVQDNSVSIASPNIPEDTSVSIGSPTPTSPPLDAAVAASRAAKIQEGIGHHLQKSTEEITQDIQNGRENTLRAVAASNMDVERQKQKLQQLTDLANSKGGPLDEHEIAKILDPFNPNNQPVDPDSVVEKQYGLKYIGSLNEAIAAFKNTPVQQAQEQIPEEADQSFLKGSELTAKMEYAKKLREDLEGTISQQSYIGRGADLVKQMFQPYNEYKMRGNTPDVGGISGGLLLGTNLQEQADHIFSLPFDQYVKTLKAISRDLAQDNPSLAHRFVSYVEGLPATDRILDNTFSVMAPMDYASLGKLGLQASRKASLAVRTDTAVRKLVKDANIVGTDAAKRAESAGDVGTAAEVKSTGIQLQTLAGKSDPIAVATDETLLTFMNQGKEKVASDTGNLSREQVTRIQDAFDASGKTLLQRIIDAARINRIPMALATQNAVRIVKEAVKEYYPGIRNAILDVSDPLYEPRSNTYWHEVTFGNFGGDLFSNPETARNFAKLHGWDDVRVIEGNGPITPPQVQKLQDRAVQLRKNIDAAEEGITNNKIRARDTQATEAERQAAKDQHEGLAEHKKGFEKELDEVELRLKNNETYDRVASLQNEVERLAAQNKDTKSRLKTADIPEENKAILRQLMEGNTARMRANQQEMRALRSGTAEVRSVDTIQQHGIGFKLIVRRPLVETDKAIRDLMIRDASGKLIPEAISTGSQEGFKSLFNAAIGKFRGADDTLSLNESINRKIGTYTQSLFKEWAHQEAAYIKQIASGVIRSDPVTGAPVPYWRAKPAAVWGKITGDVKSTYNEFVRTLDHARDALDPDTGKPGYFFQTPGELRNHYQKFFSRDPSFAEHEAYFAFVRMVEGDRIMREIAEFRNRARLGVEQFSLGVRGADGKPIKSDFFDGRRLKNFPGGDDVAMIMGRRLGEEKVVNLGGAGVSPGQLRDLREAVKQGTKQVIEVYASEHKPLQGFSDVAGNEHVRYVIADISESKPIEFNHVNRRGGGHFEYDYDHFLKQANMYHQYENLAGVKGKFKSVYTGDTTFMPLLNRIMGKDIANKMHEIQRLIRDNDLEGAKRFTEAHLPIEWDKLSAMFKPGRDESGKVTPPALDLHEPFVVVDRGKTVLDMNKDLEARYGSSFKDAAKSGSLNKQFQVAYNTERESIGLKHFDDIGTTGNPLYKYSPTSRMVDPITTMNRALNRITQTAFMDDYKIYAVEHWLREAETHLKADQSEIYSSPFYHFQNAKDKSAFKSGTPREVVNNLLSNRYKIEQFVGVPSTSQTAIQSAKQWLIDAAYVRFGPEESRSIFEKAVTTWPIEALGHATDPFTFIRSMTFHEKLGLFNPAQLLVQAQTYATILSVSPFHGTAGTYAAFLHQWARINPSMVPTLDRFASKLSVLGQSKWRPGELTEAMDALRKTGFEKVAGEYANLNTALKTDYVGNDFKSILNAGTFFFTEGERSTRLGAWYTSFREFREANPTGALSKDDLGKILQRADLLTVNMSRASNSALNTGGLSLTTQFLNYQVRLAELFMGKRLGETTFDRNMARFRMLTFYSLLYGAPSAIGITGLPLTNSIRQEAIERGYKVGENWLSTAVDQGLPAMALAHITGNGDWRKGNNYNIGARYGSPGFTQFSDALKSDHAWWQLLAGASGTTLIDTLSSSNNFFHAMGSMLKPRNEDRAFPSKLDDLIDIFKNISSVNQTWKVIAAVNTGKWMSKNEGYIGDVSKSNAALMAILGINPQQQDDAYIKNNIRKEEEAFQKHILKEFIQEQRRGYQNQKLGNDKEAQANFTRAGSLLDIGGYPVDKKATAYSIATKGMESMINDNDYALAFKNVPQSKSSFMGVPMPFQTQSNIPDTRREQFRSQSQINDYKAKP